MPPAWRVRGRTLAFLNLPLYQPPKISTPAVKARALPWTRWGLRPQTPNSAARRFLIFLAKPINNMDSWLRRFHKRFFMNGVWGLRPQRGPGAEPLAFDRSKLKAVGISRQD